jgi:hypothetical protein
MSSHPDRMHLSLEASFDLETLVCNLFATDLSTPDVTAGEPGESDADFGRIAAAHVAAGQDMLRMRPYPTGLDAASRARLFHERVHYWQLVSTPMRQLGFLRRLHGIKHGVHSAGGRAGMIAGAGPHGDPAASAVLVEDDEAVFQPFELEPEMIRGHNEIAHELRTMLVFYLRPAGPRSYPGYGALMRLPNGSALFPFSGRALMECAAYLSELLYSGAEQLPRLTDDDPRSLLYLGPWEFWARIHGPAYRDDRELAAAFLVVADVAMVTDAIETRLLDGESHAEEHNYAYRFGKLVFRLQEHEPLRLAGRDPGPALADFRDHVHRYGGALPSADLSIKKMMVTVTRHLVATLDARGSWPWDTDWIINRLLRGPAEQLVDEDWDGLRRFWEFLDAHAVHRIGHVAGLPTLTAMLNAGHVRTTHPEWFAAPHLFADELGTHLPLPLLLRDGSYHFDQYAGVVPGTPISMDAGAMAFDAMALMCLRPVRDGDATCGFIRNYTPCSYLLHGFGCPSRGLTTAEEDARRTFRIGEECHWTAHRRGVGLPADHAPPT